MELHYELTEKDYLNFQLYHTSMNKAVKTQRRNTQIIVAVVAAAMGIFFLVSGNKFAGSVLLLSAVPSYFLCGFYAKWLYRFSLQNHVAAIYRRTTPREVWLRIVNDEEIEYHERSLTQNIAFPKIEEIVSIKNYLYIKLGEKSYIIIPKAALSDPAYVQSRFEHYAETYDVTFLHQESWKWK